MSLFVAGTGIVSALGSGIGAVKAGLEASVLPDTSLESFETAGGVREVAVLKARIEGLEKFVPARSMRRMDRFSKMALLASFLAVEDAGLEFPDPSRVGVVFGSGHGQSKTSFDFMDSIIEDGDKCASPLYFSSSVHNALCSQVSINMGLTGPSLMFSTFKDSVSNVFTCAEGLLESGQLDYVLAGAGDQYSDVFTYAVLQSLESSGALSSDFMPGEGFGVFLLSAHDSGRGRIELNTNIVADKFCFEPGRKFIFSSSEDFVKNQNFKKVLDKMDSISFSRLFGTFQTSTVMDIAAGLVLKDGKDISEITCLEVPRPGMLNACKLC